VESGNVSQLASVTAWQEKEVDQPPALFARIWAPLTRFLSNHSYGLNSSSSSSAGKVPELALGVGEVAGSGNVEQGVVLGAELAPVQPPSTELTRFDAYGEVRDEVIRCFGFFSLN